MSISYEERSKIILEWLHAHPHAEDMPFTAFHEEISKIVPCDRGELSVTLTLMEMTGKVKLRKDHLGRGMGFMLPESAAAK
jgi:hypothetical protein